MKKLLPFVLTLAACMVFLSGCCQAGSTSHAAANPLEPNKMAAAAVVTEAVTNGPCWFWKAVPPTKLNQTPPYGKDTRMADVISNPAFGAYGRLIFPVNQGYYSGDTLGELRLTWYNNINAEKTVEVANYLKNRAEVGENVFLDIYTDEEKAADPAKRDTGLFFFRGSPGERFAICNAGGGFAYVGAMHDSFPLALELSKKGYNAFALIYRPGAQTACEDLARAIGFIFEHADELEVNTDDYSLWGGSAGARMAANLGSYGTAAFGGNEWPRPAAVIMQYTGHSGYTKNDPPTFAVVGESDGIANWRTMEQRINNLKSAGIDTEFHHYPNLSHGFGLGIGTVAGGWVDDAVAFWEKHSVGGGIE
jgi:acetyl esterase/lipase